MHAGNAHLAVSDNTSQQLEDDYTVLTQQTMTSGEQEQCKGQNAYRFKRIAPANIDASASTSGVGSHPDASMPVPMSPNTFHCTPRSMHGQHRRTSTRLATSVLMMESISEECEDAHMQKTMVLESSINALQKTPQMPFEYNPQVPLTEQNESVTRSLVRQSIHQRLRQKLQRRMTVEMDVCTPIVSSPVVGVMAEAAATTPSMSPSLRAGGVKRMHAVMVEETVIPKTESMANQETIIDSMFVEENQKLSECYDQFFSEELFEWTTNDATEQLTDASSSTALAKPSTSSNQFLFRRQNYGSAELSQFLQTRITSFSASDSRLNAMMLRSSSISRQPSFPTLFCNELDDLTNFFL